MDGMHTFGNLETRRSLSETVEALMAVYVVIASRCEAMPKYRAFS